MRSVALVLALVSCGTTPVKDCEEYCRYSGDVGACVDRCRKDGGEICEPEDVCDEPEDP